MNTNTIIIKETTSEDLENVLNLWNNGEVMLYVGFPQGLGITLDELQKWNERLKAHKDTARHYSIYDSNLGYCGETFYKIDTVYDLAALDIKLLPPARGKGIAQQALSYAIGQVFDNRLASRAYVDPNPENVKALALYKKLGFVSKERPEHLEPGDTYLEITRETFQRKGAMGEALGFIQRGAGQSKEGAV